MDICLITLTIDIGIQPYAHKLSKVCIHTPQSSNQNDVFYSIRRSDWMFYEYDYKTRTGGFMSK